MDGWLRAGKVWEAFARRFEPAVLALIPVDRKFNIKQCVNPPRSSFVFMC